MPYEEEKVTATANGPGDSTNGPIACCYDVVPKATLAVRRKRLVAAEQVEHTLNLHQHQRQ